MLLHPTEMDIQLVQVLSRHAHNRLKLLRILLELLDQRTHLNRLRSCSKHKHYFLHYLQFLFGHIRDSVQFVLNVFKACNLFFCFFNVQAMGVV